MEIISKADAIGLGLKRFYTGRTCHRGHVAERFVSGSGCIECKRAIRAEAAALAESGPKLPGTVHLRCVVCGAAFACRRTEYLCGQRTCSRECGGVMRSRRGWVTLQCAECGLNFKRKRSEVRSKWASFCSRECMRIHRRKLARTPAQERVARAARKYERYHSDPVNREKVKANGRASYHRRKAAVGRGLGS